LATLSSSKDIVELKLPLVRTYRTETQSPAAKVAEWVVSLHVVAGLVTVQVSGVVAPFFITVNVTVSPEFGGVVPMVTLNVSTVPAVTTWRSHEPEPEALVDPAPSHGVPSRAA